MQRGTKWAGWARRGVGQGGVRLDDKASGEDGKGGVMRDRGRRKNIYTKLHGRVSAQETMERIPWFVHPGFSDREKKHDRYVFVSLILQ